MKKIYQRPDLTVVHIQHQCLICQSVTSVENNADLNYRGGGNDAARVKGQGDYNVWDDEW